MGKLSYGTGVYEVTGLAVMSKDGFLSPVPFPKRYEVALKTPSDANDLEPIQLDKIALPSITWHLEMTPEMERMFRQMEYRRWCKPLAYHFILRMADSSGDYRLFKALKRRRGIRKVAGELLRHPSPLTMLGRALAMHFRAVRIAGQSPNSDGHSTSG